LLDKIKLEYVESAWIILYGLTNKEPKLLTETTNIFQKNLKFVLDKFEDSELLFSGLYNAFTEDKSVDRLKTVVDFVGTHGLHQFQYADSGGLQIVNTGASINDELKRQIYTHQALHSDFAFSFDEIPSFRNPDKTRTYVDEWVAPYGAKAGESLQEQIDIFKTLDTDCKIIPIIQGYDHTQIETYTKSMLTNVKKKDLKEIGAIACGNAHSNGFGTLDNFMALQNMDIPKTLKKHTHLLGVSGIDRIAPILTVVRNGLAENMERLSFDSSYHTQSYVYGEVQRSTQHLLNETKIHRLGLTRNDYVEARFTEMKEFWKDCETFNFTDLEDMFKHSIYDSEGINSPAKQLKERSEEDYLKNVNIIQMHILFNIYKYIQLLEDFISDKISFYDVFHNDKYFKFYSGLLNVKSFGDYVDWRDAAVNKYKFARAKNVMFYKDLNSDAADVLF
jgi:hypothetical protein